MQTEVPIAGGTFYRQTELYVYELTDQLGNVRAIVARKAATDTGANSQYFADYYPFGWVMPGKEQNAYRYKGQGQEYDSEDGKLTFTFRRYDGRIARFMSVDRLAAQYPFWTPYQFDGNSPIINTELEGAEEEPVNGPCPCLPEVVVTDKLPKFFQNFFNTLKVWFGLADDYQKAINNIKVREPNALESFAPVVGPGWNSLYQYQHGNNWAAGAYATLAVADVTMVSDLGSAAAKGTLILGTRIAAKEVANVGSKSLIQANRIAGNAFRDEIAAGLRAEGREVSTEVFKRTPFGARYIDIEVGQGGKIFGGIETKVGNSPYRPLQKLKDFWLDAHTPGGYPVQVVRKH